MRDQGSSSTQNQGTMDNDQVMPEGNPQQESGDSSENRAVLVSSKDLLLGHFNPQQDTAFEVIPVAFTSLKAAYLQKEVIKAFGRMHAEAKKAGFQLNIISATRNFNDQKRIWENKWNGNTLVNQKNLKLTLPDPVNRAKEILKYSSMPGTSRHHWGTDMDLNNLSPAWWEQPEGQKLYEWLSKNGPVFGFHQPYSKKSGANENTGRKTGYEEEKWHWSYSPISVPLLKAYIETITYDDIKGFEGFETAKELRMIENYVKGVASR